MRKPIESICGIIGIISGCLGAMSIIAASSMSGEERKSTNAQVELLKEQIEEKEKDREYVLELNSSKDQEAYKNLTTEIQDLNLKIDKKDAELKQFIKDCDKIRNAGFIFMASGAAVCGLGLAGQYFYDEHC